MEQFIVAMPGNEELAQALAWALELPQAALAFRRFPDGEAYLRLDAPVQGAGVILVATLSQPDERIPPLLFAADLARDLGAARIGLVAPYLCYMRQDQRFQPGEALTSKSFARWISAHFDWLVTVDPHLHRYHSLDEIYTLQSSVVTAAPAIADWIEAHVERPVLIGPDSESTQWIRAVAKPRALPWRVFEKQRHGDREVSMRLPDLEPIKGHQPVLVDDIISSGTTVAQATRHLREAGLAAPLVIGVHGLHDEQARQTLAEAGIARLICTNTVTTRESEIDLSALLIPAIRRLAGG